MGGLEERHRVKGLNLLPPIQRVVCLGAHPDDIEIGAWGLIDRLASIDGDATFHFVVLTGTETRRSEAENSIEALLGERGTLHTGEFRDGHLPYDDPAAVKQFIRETTGSLAPQVVIAPNEADRHQDHAFVSRLSEQIFRDQLILGYEILKYDGDLGRPQVFVALTEEQAAAKSKHLHDHFPSQLGKDWFSDDAFWALLRMRGIECKSPSGLAEAFYAPKILIA